MRPTTLSVFLATVFFACGGAQEGSSGPAFCESYEINFLAGCQQQCEEKTEVKPGDQAGIKTCEKQCNANLSDDGTFEDGCPDRAKQLASSN